MKRITFWLLIISFTFISGALAAALYLKFFYPANQISESLPAASLPEVENNPAELPVLAFCELVNDPEKYDGRVIRLNARLSIGLEGSWFSDASCGADNAAIISAENKEVWQDIEKAGGKNRKPWENQLDLTVVGKFKNSVYKDWCCLTTPFQFEISKVEKASKVLDYP